VRDGVEGFLVSPRDTTALTAAIARLVADPDLRTSMGKAARLRAEERFDERRVADTVVEAYSRLLHRRRAVPAARTPDVSSI
jgi:glycosyltransferase involved in cell wall biosynthesis